MKFTGKYIFEDLVGVGENIESYIDEGVAIGSYKYRINTYNSDETSEYSSEVSVKIVATLPEEPAPDPDPSILNAPALTATISANDIDLNWTDECPDAQVCYYHLERAVKIRGAIDFYEIYNETGLSYSDMGVDAGTYYYRVYMVTEGDSSDYSNTASVRIK